MQNHNRFLSTTLIRALMWASSGSLISLAGCGHESPSFQETRKEVSVSMNVMPDDQANTVAPAEAPSQSQSNDILSSLGDGSGTPSSSGDATGVSAGGGTGAAADGTTSNGATTGTTGGDTSTASSGDGSAAGSNGSDGSSTSSGGASSGNGTSTGSTTQNTTTLPPAGDESITAVGAQPTAAELKACAKIQGVDVNSIKVVGNQTNVSITSGSVAAIKLTGNQPTLKLDLEGDGSVHLAGLCLFLAGNQAQANVTLGIATGRLVYVGRGNQSQCDVNVASGGSLDYVAASLSGNQAALHIHGQGTHVCPASASLSGHEADFQCE